MLNSNYITIRKVQPKSIINNREQTLIFFFFFSAKIYLKSVLDTAKNRPALRIDLESIIRHRYLENLNLMLHS